MLLAPALLAGVAGRGGWRAFGLGSAVAIAVAAFLDGARGSIGGLPTLVFGGIVPALCVGWAARRGQGPLRTIFGAVALQIALLALPMTIVAMGAAAADLELALHGRIDEAVEILRSDRSGSAVDVALRLEEQRDFIVRWALRMTPSVMVVWVVVSSWLAVLHLVWATGQRAAADALLRFRSPAWMRWVLALAAAGVAIGGRVAPEASPDLLRVGAVNIVVVSSLVFGLQGVAVTNWFIHRLEPGPFARAMSPWLQALLWFTFPFTWVFTILLGIADNWFDVRSLDEAEDPQR